MFTPLRLRIGLAIVAALAVGCSDENEPNGPDGLDPQSLSLYGLPEALTLAPGASDTLTIYVGNVAAAAGPVVLSATAAPAGVTLTFSPSSVTKNWVPVSLHVAAAAATVPGAYAVTIHASATGVQAAVRTLTLEIVAPGPGAFRISAPDRIDVEPNGTPTHVEVTITRIAPFAGPVTVVAAGVPEGLNATLSPASTLSGSMVLTLSASPALAYGTHRFTLRGTAPGLPDQVEPVEVTVEAPPVGELIMWAVPSTATLEAGGPAVTITINIVRRDFTGRVAIWEPMILPAGLTWTQPSETIAASDSSMDVSIQAASGTTPGLYTLRVLGYNVEVGYPLATVDIPVTVEAP